MFGNRKNKQKNRNKKKMQRDYRVEPGYGLMVGLESFFYLVSISCPASSLFFFPYVGKWQ